MSTKKAFQEKEFAQQLIEPMIFFKEDGTPLKPAMDFFVHPEGKKLPLPPQKPLDLDYFVNWKEFNEQVGVNSNSLPITDNQIGKVPPLKTSQFKEESIIVNGVKETTPPSAEESQYEVMEKFLSQTNLLVIKERFYLYKKVAYLSQTSSEIMREVMRVCRTSFKNKPNGFIEGVGKYLLKEPRICIAEEEIPYNLVSFQNCILDIKKRTTHFHNPRFLTFYYVKANYTPNNIPSTPIFDKFLDSISGGDATLKERILQMLGYCMTLDTSAKCFFLLQGIGNSGKSVLANFLQELFDVDSIMPLDLKSYGSEYGSSNLVGKVITSAADLPNDPLNEATVSKLKQFTGDDMVSSNVKYGQYVKFVCRAKIIVTTNHALLTKTDDPAFFYRICTIPFRYSISREDQNVNLKNDLLKEKDGVVTKAMLAYFRLVDQHYRFAGNYQCNECISISNEPTLNYRMKIFEFAKFSFQKDENGIIFTDDAHKAFCKKYGSVPFGDFSHHFQIITSDLFEAKKGRKRKPGETNPISCIKGISFNSTLFQV